MSEKPSPNDSSQQFPHHPRRFDAGDTAAIAAEIEAADANLENILDRFILQFAEDHPNFTTAYATARKIVNAGGGHAATPTVPAVPVAPPVV